MKGIVANSIKKFAQVVRLHKHSDVSDQTVFDALETAPSSMELMDVFKHQIIILIRFDDLDEYSSVLTGSIESFNIEAVNDSMDQDQSSMIYFSSLLKEHGRTRSTKNQLS